MAICLATLITGCGDLMGPSPTTYVYKEVHGLELKADVYGAQKEDPFIDIDNGKPKLKPVLLWIHGGALIFGHRRVAGSSISMPANREPGPFTWSAAIRIKRPNTSSTIVP